MDKKKIDTIGRICPYPVRATVREMDNLKKDDELEVLFDDPLALKSILMKLNHMMLMLTLKKERVIGRCR